MAVVELRVGGGEVRARMRAAALLAPERGQALEAQIEELRAELAAVRAWCEGLEDEQALLWRSQGVHRGDAAP